MGNCQNPRSLTLFWDTAGGQGTQESPGKMNQSYVWGPPPCSQCILLTKQLSSSLLNAILSPPFPALRCLIPTGWLTPEAVGIGILFLLTSLVILTVVFFLHAGSMSPVYRPASGSVWWLPRTPCRASEFSLIASGVQVALVHGARLPQGFQAFCLGHRSPRKLSPVSPAPGLCFPSTSMCPRPSTEHAQEL